MKIKGVSFLMIIMVVNAGCKSDENSNPDPDYTSKVVPTIAFVLEDGRTVNSGDCIDPADTYQVAISAVSTNVKDFPVTVEYTVNDNLARMTFTQSGTKTNPVTLEPGENEARLVKSGTSVNITLVLQEDFELVD